MWRIQQISTPANMAMLAVNLTLTVTAYIKWRFGSSYIGIIVAFLILAGIIGTVGWAWDRLRMWHEQNVVNVERNPYNERKMSPKEVYENQIIWVPILEHLGNKKASDIMARWTKEQLEADPSLKSRVEEMREHFEHDT
jgi:hypothetical protein